MSETADTQTPPVPPAPSAVPPPTPPVPPSPPPAAPPAPVVAPPAPLPPGKKANPAIKTTPSPAAPKAAAQPSEVELNEDGFTPGADVDSEAHLVFLHNKRVKAIRESGGDPDHKAVAPKPPIGI